MRVDFKIVDRALAWEEWNIPRPKAMWGIILYISYIYLWALSKIWHYYYLCVRFNKNYPFTVCKVDLPSRNRIDYL